MTYKSMLSTILLLNIYTQAYGIGLNDSMLICLSSSHLKTIGQKYSYAQNSKGSYQDVTGDTLEFIDLSKMEVAIDDSKISIEISLTHIPDMLIYDRADISDNDIEYEWAIFFDIDEDNTPANDISISLSSFKFKGEKVSIGNVKNFTQRNVWLFGSDGSSTSLTDRIDVTVVDRTTFSLIVGKGSHKASEKITEQTPVRFSTLYNFGRGVCEDFYPDIRISEKNSKMQKNTSNE